MLFKVTNVVCMDSAAMTTVGRYSSTGIQLPVFNRCSTYRYSACSPFHNCMNALLLQKKEVFRLQSLMNGLFRKTDAEMIKNIFQVIHIPVSAHSWQAMLCETMHA